MTLQNGKVKREYCSWEPVVFQNSGTYERMLLRGDLNGVLDYDSERNLFYGLFEFPVRGCEKGFYEIAGHIRGKAGILRRVEVDYSFDERFFSPRWENVDRANRFISEYYAPYAGIEVVHRYGNCGREIQMLSLSDPSVPSSAKQVVLVTGRIHNPESGMTSVCYRYINWLLRGAGKKHLKEYIFLIIPMTIPLTFEEDKRSHNVNRLWQPVITAAPDVDAIRENVIDRYTPDIWIDCHSFNSVLPLEDVSQERDLCGDYVVAHPVKEKFFDYDYSTDIALRMIQAAERAGHKHRNEAFFRKWAENLEKTPLRAPGEKIVTEHHPSGIFSGRDYARYADRGKFGPGGRDWPAMACDYGYFRCHALNFCLECKPLHVLDKSCGRVLHYPGGFLNSNVEKLKEICLIGNEDFQGQPFPGFPCNIISSDTDGSPQSVMLCAWGGNRDEIRRSRYVLWNNRFSIVLRRIYEKRAVKVMLSCFSDIEIPAALRLDSKDYLKNKIEGQLCGSAVRRNGFVYLPFRVKTGMAVFASRPEMNK